MALKKGKNIVKQALLKDLKESSEVRIKNGDLKGLDIWQTIAGGGDGHTDFVVVELYDDLTNYHKNRSLGKNLKNGILMNQKNSGKIGVLLLLIIAIA